MAALFHLTYVISKPIIKALGEKTDRGHAEKHIYFIQGNFFFFLAFRDLVVILRKSQLFESYSHSSLFPIKVPTLVILM